MLTVNSRGGGTGTGGAAAGRPTGRNARLSKAVMAKVDRVMEVCSVSFDEAHRVLQDNGMDVQRTIERFVSGTLFLRSIAFSVCTVVAAGWFLCCVYSIVGALYTFRVCAMYFWTCQILWLS